VIRRYRPDDAPALAALFRRSVLGLGPRDYTPAQVAAWAARSPGPEALARRWDDGRAAFVALDGADRPAGFADLEADGHIDLLYVAPEAAGAGTGAALVAAVEREARERGIARLYVEASEAARRLLLRHGFAELRRRDFEIGGVAIHNYAMEKRLAP
jgi:putative acetyltransferase